MFASALGPLVLAGRPCALGSYAPVVQNLAVVAAVFAWPHGSFRSQRRCRGQRGMLPHDRHRIARRRDARLRSAYDRDGYVVVRWLFDAR